MKSEIVSFVASSVYPKLTEDVIFDTFSFLQPEMVNGEHCVMHCPDCNGEANYYLKTGALSCKVCGSFKVEEIYAAEHGCRCEEAVRLLCLDMNIKIPTSLYKQVAPKSIYLTQAFKELTVPDHLPADLKKLGFKESEIAGNRHVSLYKSAEQIVEIITDILGKFPASLADSLKRFENQLVISRMQYGRLHLVNKDNEDAPGYGYIQNFEPETINKGFVIVTDDMLTAVMAWHYGYFCAYFSPNRSLTPKQYAHVTKFYNRLKVVAIWCSEIHRSNVFHEDQKRHYFPWLNSKQAGSYDRVREVITNVC